MPVLGYREYWYPAVEAKRVGRNPVRAKLLGEELVFFRAKDGKVAALWDRCPHRGALLSYGRCEFPGTISCPYHGYTYDETGTCVAALTEGPESALAGKLKARSYPTTEVRGTVFVWMGETAPVPIEEDVPEDLFDEKSVTVFKYVKKWPMNWAISIENVADSHDSYLHRYLHHGGWYAAVVRMLNWEAFQKIPAYWSGTDIVDEGENWIAIKPKRYAPQQAYYPMLGKRWPQRVWWRFLTGFRWRRGTRTWSGKPYTNEYRLPAITRVDFASRMNWRWSTPIDEDQCLVFNFICYHRRNWLYNFWARLHFRIIHWYWWFKLVQAREDMPVQAHDRLDRTAPNKLGINDRTIIYWRRRMPLKSRDNQRIWKQCLPPDEEAVPEEISPREQAATRP